MGARETLLPQEQLCFPLYAAARETVKRYNPLLDALGLTYTQFLVLTVLRRGDPLSVKALGTQLYLDSGTLTPVLKTMEKKGWLTRRRSAEDERVVLVQLTDAGRHLQEETADIPDQVASCLPLTAEETAQLCRLLRLLLSQNT